MKKVLLSFVLLGAVGLFSNVNAQCSIGIPNVSNITTSTTSGTGHDSCFVTFDLSFAMKNNNGNKTIGIDLWQADSYVSPMYANVPSPAELSNSLGSIMINNNSTGSPIDVNFLSTYPSGSSVRLLSHGRGTRTYKASVDSFNFNITGIKIGVPKNSDGSCPVSMLTVKGNVWATNAGSYNANTSVQCLSGISFSLGNPIISSAKATCTQKFLNFTIETISPSDITVTYKVFKDDNSLVNGQPVYNSSLDNTEITPEGTQPVTINSNSPFSSPSISYPTGDSYYWVVVYYTPTTGPTAGQTYSVSRAISTCSEASALPVTFKSFSATRNNASTVGVKWEIAFEQNNRGFYVQRNVNGEWKNVAFVFSRADGGNSDQALSYAYNDPNNLKSISYYRIQQVDMDGKVHYSDIRTVRGEEQSSKLMLFPNPGTNGTINVQFDDETSAKEVIVYDANGRAVKSFKNIVGSSLTIEQLKPGIYNIQVKNTASQVISSDKFIIQN